MQKRVLERSLETLQSLAPLLRGEDPKKCVEALEAYGLRREHLVDHLASLRLKTQARLYESVDSKTKAALTRCFNALHPPQEENRRVKNATPKALPSLKAAVGFAPQCLHRQTRSAKASKARFCVKVCGTIRLEARRRAGRLTKKRKSPRERTRSPCSRRAEPLRERTHSPPDGAAAAQESPRQPRPRRRLPVPPPPEEEGRAEGGRNAPPRRPKGLLSAATQRQQRGQPLQGASDSPDKLTQTNSPSKAKFKRKHLFF